LAGHGNICATVFFGVVGRSCLSTLAFWAFCRRQAFSTKTLLYFRRKAQKHATATQTTLQRRRQKSATAQTFAHGCLLKQKNNEPYTDKTSA